MIGTLFCEISDRMKGTGFFSKFYELCELIDKGEGLIVPMYYKGKKSGYVDVQNFDVNGVGYVRKTGNVRMQLDSSVVKVTSCQEDMLSYVVANIPLRMVVAIPKDSLEDSPFMDDSLCADLIGALQGNYGTTAQSMDAKSVKVFVNSYDTSSLNIWANENRGVAFDESVIFRFSYIAIDFTECFYKSYEKIKNRTGRRLDNGVFIKDE